MDHHLDAVVRQAVELVRLDHLQALVDQSGGVDGDHRAHVPGGVGQRPLEGDLGQLGAAAPEKGPPLAVSTSRRTSAAEPAPQALQQRRMLRVDRRAGRFRRGPHQRTAGDQGLLVGQGDDTPGAGRPGSSAAPGAVHPVEHPSAGQVASSVIASGPAESSGS